MHPTTYHQLATFKQADMLREASNERLARDAKEARRAAGNTGNASGLAGLMSSLMHVLRPAKGATLGSAKPSAA